MSTRDQTDHEHHQNVPLEPPPLQGVHDEPVGPVPRELVRPHVVEELLLDVVVLLLEEAYQVREGRS